ncbi:hypothetical protein [Oceanitalea stevensii]|uniref:Uncharacterized protein n=1 Tax=Oceanitalea stevensii TaxID=2763072 RepID=A0ABR8Z268_9MICO|nr:hypothetical protein [Oceanitalea stevensii]MBD8062423.1 hypothetical protein [Oceanitalea stevensii]
MRTAEAAGHVALIQGMDVGGGDAAWFGTLGVNEKGCLGLAGPHDEVATVVIWPAGTRLDDDGSILDDRGRAVRIGDELEAGGGEEPFVASYPEQAERCLEDPADDEAVVIVLWTVTAARQPG